MKNPMTTRQIMKYMLFSILTIALLSTSAGASFAGGTGYSNDPYKISTVDQLQDMKNYMSKHFILINDIDASETRTWNGNQGFDPIGGYNSYPFTGTLDGQGYNITGLYINRPSQNNVGVFEFTREATIENIGLVNAEITGSSAGGLCGYSYISVINNTFVIGNITGTSTVGGLAGYAEGQPTGIVNNSYFRGNVTGSGSYIGGITGQCTVNITNSYVIGNITGSNYVGGVAGRVYGGKLIDHCYTNVNISGSSQVGGLIGVCEEEDFVVSNCHSQVNVSAISSQIGGLIGNNDADVTNCSASGNIIGGTQYIGGLIGYTGGADTYRCHANVNITSTAAEVGGLIGHYHYGTFTQCYATGNVAGSTEVGGLVGSTRADMYNCYARGNVSASDYAGGVVGHHLDTHSFYRCYSTGRVTCTGSNKGGVVGATEGWVTYSYWDIETSGETTKHSNEEGKNTSEMKNQSTYHTSWDFDTIWDICYNATSS